MDSSAPCATPKIDPLPPSARQAQLFEAVTRAEAVAGGRNDVITGNVFRPCSEKSADPQLTTFTALRSGNYIIVSTACGHEGA